MRRVVSFLVGVILGGLVGTTLSLLLAPSSGDEMRSQVRDRYQRMVDEMKSAATARRAELEKQLSVLRAPQKPPAA